MNGPRPERDEAVRRLGNALRNLQQQSGCTLRSLETQVRISDSSLSRYFRGEIVPVWPVVRDLCQAMGADPAEYRALWEAADRTRLGEAGDDGTGGSPDAAGPSRVAGRAWWRPSRAALSHRWAVAAVAAAAGSLVTGVLMALLLSQDGSGGSSVQGAAGSVSGDNYAGVVVYNAEKACQKLRTHDCALSLAYDPYRPYVRANAAGRVWHRDLLQARCTVADGVTVTDENGKHSSIWIQVAHGGTHVWLPGIRVEHGELTQLTRLLPRCPSVSPR